MANKLLTINLRKYLSKQPRRKRPSRLPRYIRYRIAKSTNVSSQNIRISKELNSLLMKRYLYSMKPLKVNISIEKDKALVTHFEMSKQPTAKAEVSKDVKAAPAALQTKKEDEAKPAQPADQKKAKVAEKKTEKEQNAAPKETKK